MPSYAKFLKDIITNKRKLEEFEMVKLNEECSTILQNKLPPKLKDPGSFSIPCTIGEINFDKALCDLGASINLMPFFVFRKLGLKEPTPTTVSLQLADRSIKYLRGVVEDVLVKVDKFIFLVDFIVLDMEEDHDMPLILGRPFLATERALIDVQQGKLSFRINDEVLRIDCIDDLVDRKFHAFRLDDPIENCIANSFDVKDQILDEQHKEAVGYLGENQKFNPSKRDELLPLDVSSSSKARPSIEKPHILELKPLPSHLKYVYLGDSSTLPMIISSFLIGLEEEKLMRVLMEHKKAFGWSIADIHGISRSICMHKILMEEGFNLMVQPQRRLNPNMQEVMSCPLTCHFIKRRSFYQM
ncbi:uncharacterized protein LOC127794196 [Diospyros lotus]|uniref:uncharacterized protein LOC127794196 n=1 Tax=Diospyros lotus TaxID=55363 RepID=UPI00224FCF1E|nr:uncharacterized protein LOC127794196 [Diospyros lotus]